MVNHTQEVFGRHVGCYFATAAITTTVKTMDIATECGLPKELLQWVQLLEVLAAQPLKLEYDALAEVHYLFLLELEFDIYDSKIECHNRIHRVY